MSDETDVSTEQAIADVEGQLSALFNRARAGWKDYAASVHPDLQPAGYKILGTLVRGGPAHAGALAEQLHTDKSVISRQVRLMEQLGLVESRADETDGRARVLAATPMALEKVSEVRRNNQARLYELLRTWPEDDIRKFAELLGRLSF
ncbi:MAG: MarR family winged helix-turn-helix transcriptional regulator [Leifsonia sp.]